MCSGLQLESNRTDTSITGICLQLKNCLLPKKLNWPRYTAFRPKSTKRNFDFIKLLTIFSHYLWYIIVLARREKCWCETTAQLQKMQLFWDLWGRTLHVEILSKGPLCTLKLFNNSSSSSLWPLFVLAGLHRWGFRNWPWSKEGDSGTEVPFFSSSVRAAKAAPDPCSHPLQALCPLHSLTQKLVNSGTN